jgi:hypothetical protein
MSALAKQLQGQVQFVFVYCQEFHPHQEASGPAARDESLLKQSESHADREKRARQFQRLAESDARRILVDEDGTDGFTRVQSAYHAYFHARTFIVDRGERIVWIKNMAEAADVEKALAELFPKRVSPPSATSVKKDPTNDVPASPSGRVRDSN